MKILPFILILAFCSTYAEGADYKRYTNEKLGVSFEYPSWAEAEDNSQKDILNVWFHIGEWPKNMEYIGDKRPKSPVSGVSFSVKEKGDFHSFLVEERAEIIRSGNQNEIKENRYAISDDIIGIEFVHDAKKMNKTIYHFIFPSLKQNVILSFWHMEQMGPGFLWFPEEEAKAILEYRHMIKTLRIFK